jgi:hypothetical protein
VQVSFRAGEDGAREVEVSLVFAEGLSSKYAEPEADGVSPVFRTGDVLLIHQ